MVRSFGPCVSCGHQGEPSATPSCATGPRGDGDRSAPGAAITARAKPIAPLAGVRQAPNQAHTGCWFAPRPPPRTSASASDWAADPMSRARVSVIADPQQNQASQAPESDTGSVCGSSDCGTRWTHQGCAGKARSPSGRDRAPRLGRVWSALGATHKYRDAVPFYLP